MERNNRPIGPARRDVVPPKAAAPVEGGSFRVVTVSAKGDKEETFEVYKGKRRVAWGLKDYYAAKRWVDRLGGTIDTSKPPSSSSRGVWWNAS